MALDDSSVARLTLAAAVIALNILWTVIIRPPNGAAAERHAKSKPVNDRLSMAPPRLAFLFVDLFTAWHILCGIYHAVLIYTFPNPPVKICPQALHFSKSSDPTMYTWNPFLATSLLLALCVAGPIRILAFRNLGTNFTFALKEPDRLVKTGVHSYMQHPSYTGLVLFINCMLFIYGRFGGLPACFVPPNWLEPLGWTQPFIVGVMSCIVMISAWMRVTDEEKMLKAHFGKEWEEYHHSTKRFIPGVI